VVAGAGPALAQSDLAKAPGGPAVQTAVPLMNAPLTAGKAAGIREAQGSQRNRIWTYAPFAAVTGLALLVVLATGDDDNSTTTTTGSN